MSLAWEVTTPEGKRLLDCGRCVVDIVQSSEAATVEQVEIHGDEEELERCSKC